MIAALSEYATTVPCGFCACVWRTMPNSDFVLSGAVDDPVGVEDLVPAVLRVRLREHHQLDVGGIAPHALEIVQQVVDLILG